MVKINYKIHLKWKLRENWNTSDIGQEYGPRLQLKPEVKHELVAQKPNKGKAQTWIRAQKQQNGAP